MGSKLLRNFKLFLQDNYGVSISHKMIDEFLERDNNCKLRTFRFSGIDNGFKFVKTIQAEDKESAIANFESTFPSLTWRTITNLD